MVGKLPKIELAATALLPRLARVLSAAHMGTQFYLAGSEGLIGQAEREIMNTGFPHASVQKEQRGSTLRRGYTADVNGGTINRGTPAPC